MQSCPCLLNKEVVVEHGNFKGMIYVSFSIEELVQIE